jgi:hypothetical protein
VQWLDLPKHIYLKLPSGDKVRAKWDAAQVGETRLSSVQYLKFPVANEVPVGIGVDHPNLSVSAAFTPEQRSALAQDLS